MRWVLVVAGCTLAPFVAGCGGECGSPTSQSLSPAESTLHFTMFTGYGCSDTQTLDLTYTGGGTMLEVGPVPAGFSAVVLKDPDRTDHLALTLTFIPQTVGVVSGDIQLSAPDAQATIHVTGTGEAPSYDTAPSELDFGEVLIGTSRSLPMSLAAMQLTPFCNSGGHLEVSSDDPAFSISPPSIDLSGSDSTITVTFTPTSPGAFDGPHLRIRSCDTCDVLVRVVKGLGSDGS